MTDYTQLIERLNDAWANHTGCEPSESVMSQAIEDTCVALEALQAELTTEHMNCLMLEGSLKTLQARVLEFERLQWNEKAASVLQAKSNADDLELSKLEAERDTLASKLAALEGQEHAGWLISFEYLASTENINGSLKKFKENWIKSSFLSESKDAEIDATKYRNRQEKAIKLAAGAQAQPLTKSEITALYMQHMKYQEEMPEASGVYHFARAVEAAHGIGGSV